MVNLKWKKPIVVQVCFDFVLQGDKGYLNRYIKLEVVWYHNPIFSFPFLAIPHSKFKLSKENISDEETGIEVIFLWTHKYSHLGMERIYCLRMPQVSTYITSWGVFITSSPLYQCGNQLLSFEVSSSWSRYHGLCFWL